MGIALTRWGLKRILFPLRICNGLRSEARKAFVVAKGLA